MAWLLSIVLGTLPDLWIVAALAAAALYIFAWWQPGRLSAEVVRLGSLCLLGLAVYLWTFATATAAYDARVRAAVEAAVRAAGGDGTSSTGALYVTPEGRSLGESLAAVINALTADGHEVATSAWFVTEYGERRVVGGPGTPARFDAVVIVATSEAAERRLDAGERPVAEWDPLDATERAEARRLMRGLATAFRAAGRADLADAAERHRLHEALAADDPLPLPGVSTADVERLTELELRGIRVAVFIDPTPRNAADIVAEGARIPDVWP